MVPRLLAIAILVIAALVLVVRFWGLQAYLRYRLQRELPTYWDGTCRIERLEVTFGGRVRLGGLSLTDTEGRTWLTVPAAETTLTALLTGEPRAETVDVDGLRLDLHFREGRCRPPVRNVDRLIEWIESVTDLRELHVRNGTVALRDDRREAAYELDGLFFHARRLGEVHRVELRRNPRGPDDQRVLSAEGTTTWDTGRLELVTSVSLPVSDNQGREICTLLAVPGIEGGSGVLAGTVKVRGVWTRPLSWRPSGTIHIRDLTIRSVAGAEITDSRLTLSIGGTDRLLASLDTFQGRICNGWFAVSGSASIDPSVGSLDAALETLRYQGLIRGAGIDLSSLLPAAGDIAGRSPWETGVPDNLGTLLLRYSVSGKGTELSGCRGRGAFALEGTNLWQLPMMPEMISQLSVEHGSALGASRVEAAFSSSGSLLTFEEARVVSRLFALEVESGGTVDLAGGEADFYAVAIPLQRIHQFLSYLPLMDIVPFLQRSLTRMHVTGRLVGDGDLKVRSAPAPSMKLTEDMREFFVRATRGKGDIPGRLLKQFRKLLDVPTLFGERRELPSGDE